MYGLGFGRQCIKPLGIRVQQCRHLVNEGAGAAGAGLVHAQVHRTPEIEDFCVLAAKLYGHVCLRGKPGDNARGGDNFLHKEKTKRLGKIQGAGTRHCAANDGIRELAVQFFKYGGQGLPRCRTMPLILFEENMTVFRG